VRKPRLVRLLALCLISALALAVLWTGRSSSAHGEDADRSSVAETTDDSPAASPGPPSPVGGQAPTVNRRLILGRSVLGRPIRAAELGDPTSARRLLVVGCIHGNECAGLRIARALSKEHPPTSADVWIIFNANPDGFARGTRQNAHGVDLNRNFPFRWRPIDRPGSLYYSGPRAVSEPETRASVRFIRRTEPTVSIWFHQHLDLVDESGGSVSIERAFARMVGLPIGRLPSYPGSATTWQDHAFAGTTAFVVELPAGALSDRSAERYADAALALVS
jgi:protein MpaA